MRRLNGYLEPANPTCDNCRKELPIGRVYHPRNYQDPKPDCCSADCAKFLEHRMLLNCRAAAGAIH